MIGSAKVSVIRTEKCGKNSLIAARFSRVMAERDRKHARQAWMKIVIQFHIPLNLPEKASTWHVGRQALAR
jgi:hypothetical protein